MKKVLFILISALFFIDCSPKISLNNASYYGKKITPEGAITYEQLLSEISHKEKISNIKVKGKVNAVCQMKGCWMTIISDHPGAEEMFVKFENYGFFMPKDAGGSTAFMEGDAFWEVTPVDELRHYAEDEGKSEEEIKTITEPVKELKFLAKGVILVK